MKQYDGVLHAIFAKDDYERIDNILLDLFQCGFQFTDVLDNSRTDYVEDLIANSKAVIVFISARSLQDVSVANQIKLADQFEKQIIPFFLDDPDELSIPNALLLLFDGTSRINAYEYAENKAMIDSAKREIGKFFVVKNKKMSKTVRILSSAAAVLLIVFAVGMFSTMHSKSNAVEHLQSATVKVICLGEANDENAGSQGSGFIISNDMKIVTNYHVVEGNSKYYVKMYNDKIFEAELIVVDTENDLAVLQASKNAAYYGYSVLKFAYSIPNVGDKCYVGGYPQGIDLIVSDGIISSGNKTYENEAGVASDYLAITAAISPGNSGGAVINDKGDVIGVVTGKISDADNFGLSRPAKYAKELLKNIPD